MIERERQREMYEWKEGERVREKKITKKVQNIRNKKKEHGNQIDK